MYAPEEAPKVATPVRGREKVETPPAAPAAEEPPAAPAAEEPPAAPAAEEVAAAPAATQPPAAKAQALQVHLKQEPAIPKPKGIQRATGLPCTLDSLHPRLR